MSLFNEHSSQLFENVPSNVIVNEIELKFSLSKYIDNMRTSEWSYHFNRVFISPGNSFNIKYIIKFLTSTLTKCRRNIITETHTSNISDTKQLISQGISSEITRSQLPDNLNNINIFKNDDFVENEDEFVINNILDRLTSSEFIKLLQIVPEKRKETIMHHYRAYNSILENMPLGKLDTGLNNNIQIEVPYEIYLERTNENKEFSKYNTVHSSKILELLKSCGVIILDVSRDNLALSKGKNIFDSFKKEILINCMTKSLGLKSKILIVVISTIMTWTGSANKKKRTINEYNVNNRFPNAEFMEHYEFEREVLAVNKTDGLKDVVMTIIIWSGLTYGFEQDFFKFVFDSACNKDNDEFIIPKSHNHVPMLHVENLARIVYKTLTEHRTLKCCGILAIESPINTLKQIITVLGKTCDVASTSIVSLDTFINKYKLAGIHKEMIVADIKVHPNINQLWPKFEWYNGKSSLNQKMKYLVETYKTEHNIKNIKLLILGPPSSGKTKLALQLAEYYNLMYLEPQDVVDNHINGIRKELISLRQTKEYMLSVDINDEIDVKEIDPLLEKKISDLDQKLNSLYSSMDDNNGMLEDAHLIPLFNNEICLHSSHSKYGYVLDGYPITVDQAKKIFNSAHSIKQIIDVNKLPDLTVVLKKNPVRFNLNDVYSDDKTNTVDGNVLGKTSVKEKRIAFSEINTMFSSEHENDLLPNSSVKFTKTSILKKSNTDKHNGWAKKIHLIWSERDHNNLLKMLNCYYVPIKTIDSSYSLMDYHVDTVELREKHLSFESLLNVVIKEIQLILHRDSFLDKNFDIKNAMPDEMVVERSKYKQLKEKMTTLEEFEKYITDFEQIKHLSTDEYLTNYVTPTLTKFIAQMAIVRPSNPVDFLAHMALKENPDGLFDCPGYSKEGIRIQRLLQRTQTQSTDLENNEEINEEETVSFYE